MNLRHTLQKCRLLHGDKPCTDFAVIRGFYPAEESYIFYFELDSNSIIDLEHFTGILLQSFQTE